jgi:hypothetical protein
MSVVSGEDERCVGQPLDPVEQLVMGSLLGLHRLPLDPPTLAAVPGGLALDGLQPVDEDGGLAAGDVLGGPRPPRRTLL